MGPDRRPQAEMTSLTCCEVDPERWAIRDPDRFVLSIPITVAHVPKKLIYEF